MSIVIATHNRPDLLRRAVTSALRQTLAPHLAAPADAGPAIEVIVVDDGSEPPVDLGPEPGIHLVRQEHRGGAAARNTGLDAARGGFITYLDDDDELTSGAVNRALQALHNSELPAPIVALAAVDEVGPDGRVVATRLPPSLDARVPFPLLELAPGRSHGVKQTALMPTDLLRTIGGWDAMFRSRVHTELFMRLGAVCSFQGIDDVGYRLATHEGRRVSGNPALRQESWRRLTRVHETAMRSHPRGAAALALRHARASWQQREWLETGRAVIWALRRSPTRVAIGVVRAIGSVAGAASARRSVHRAGPGR